MKKLLILMIVGVILASGVYAEQSQQFNKIFLDPFYRQSMNAEDYNYTVTVDPPDGFSDVSSAIINFQLWLNPTVEFFILVDGQTCNTVSYEVHTTYANAGEGSIFFDCSNVIDHAGTYTITLTPDDDTGAITGWLDITYTNNPKGELEILGTEYLPNDYGTIFLQLRDTQGIPVLQGACYLDVYNPLVNGTHTKYLDSAPMLSDNSDVNGIYYYDLTTPTVEGNYMLAATCSYSYQTPIWVYGPEDAKYPLETDVSNGVWVGDSQALNDKSDGIYEKCTSTSGTDGCLTYFNYEFPAGDYAENTTINVFYSGQSTKPRYTEFGCKNVSNISQIIYFTNQLYYSGYADVSTTTNVDDYLSNVLPDDCIDRNQSSPNVTLTFSIDDNGIIVYHNWLTISVLATAGNVQDLKGSSEMHITNIPYEVWNHYNRNLTNISEVAGDLWTTYDNRTLTNISNVAGDIWFDEVRTVTNLSNVAGDIWFDEVRTLTNFSNVAGDVWAYNQTVNIGLIEQFVYDIWNYVARYTHGEII